MEKIRKLFENFKYYLRSEKPYFSWVLATQIKGKLLNFQSYIDFILKYHKQNLSTDIKCCVAYIKKHGIQMYPYNWYKRYFIRKVNIIYDTEKKLYYVIHRNKKLYFPKDFSKSKIMSSYNGLCAEQDKMSPHRYYDENFPIQGGVFVDVGAAEGMITLENIENIEKAYLIECNSGWIEALKATFEPYKDKVVIVPKLAADFNDIDTVTLDSIIEEREKISIKMDVEGFELQVLKGAVEIMTNTKKKNVAVCCYHRCDDKEILIDFLKKYFKNISIVPNYLYCPYNLRNGKKAERSMPYLRSAVIRAE